MFFYNCRKTIQSLAKNKCSAYGKHKHNRHFSIVASV